MRAIAPSMPQHVFPREGRRRPTPRLRAACDFIDIALVAVYGLSNGYVERVAGRAGAMRAIAPSMPPNVFPGRAAGGPRREYVP
jgi:hypothetical protein